MLRIATAQPFALLPSSPQLGWSGEWRCAESTSPGS